MIVAGSFCSRNVQGAMRKLRIVIHEAINWKEIKSIKEGTYE